MIFHRTPQVPVLGDYHQYRDHYLRPDFQYRCAYCLIKEGLFLEEGGGEIDHHRPLHPPAATGQEFLHLKNVYTNLYWTCGKCNSEKGNTWPTGEEYAAGLRFLDPCVEDHREHWDTKPNGTLHPKTSVGQYTIINIRLDRRFLNTMRRRFAERKRKVAKAQEKLAASDLTPEDRTFIEELLADDFLVDTPAFLE